MRKSGLPFRTRLWIFAGLLAASPLVAFDLVPNTGFQGQTIAGVKCVTRPLPASGATVTFLQPGLTPSNLRNDSSGFLLFDLAISPTAPVGPYAGIYSHPTAGVASNPTAFTVLASGTPTPSQTPTPSPTSPPGTTPTPTPTPTPGFPQPTPQPGSLRIAPDQITEGTHRVRLIIAGSDFNAGTTVKTPPDIRLDAFTVLSPTRLELLVSNALGTPSGPRVFVVNTPSVALSRPGRAAGSSGTVIVTVIPADSLGAPLSVTTVAIVSPQRGAFVAEGERVYARGLLATTGTGVILGSWQLDGVPFDRFEAFASGGAPVSIESKVPIPLDTVGDHYLQLVVDHPQDVASERVLVLRVARRAARLRAIEPDDGIVGAGPPRFRWTLLPGAQAYEVVFSSDLDENAGVVRFRSAEASWTPTAWQWKQVDSGLRFWAVRPIFPVDVRGALTPWRHIAVTPERVALEPLSAGRDPTTGAPLLAWRGGAPGLVYRVSFFRSGAEPAFFSALTARTSYRVRDALVRAAEGPVLYAVEALVPGGNVIGRSSLSLLKLPPGLERAAQTGGGGGRIPTEAELAALEKRLADEDEDIDISHDWKVDVSGIVTFRSGSAPAGADTAHVALSSASSFVGNRWKLEETVELAGHVQISPQTVGQDSRNWVVRGGGGSQTWRADAAVGYSPPVSLDGLQLLSGGLSRGGAEARLTTPLGAFSGYSSFDDKLFGDFSSTTGGEQRLRFGAYDAPLPSDRFLLRGVYLDVRDDGPTGPPSASKSQLWGGIVRFALSPAFVLTFEGAHSRYEPSLGGNLEGNAFRTNVEGSLGTTSYALNLYDTKATFLNIANRGLTLSGQPNRIGGDALLLQRLGRFSASATYRYLENETGGAHAKSQAGTLTFNAPLARAFQVSASGLWTLDRGDASNGALGPLPRTNRTSYGGRLNLTELLGRLSLSEAVSWTRVRDDVSSVNSATTKSANLLANGAITSWFFVAASVVATRSQLALSGNNDSVIAFVQPRWIIPALRLTFAPRAAYSYFSSGASPVISRGEQYQAFMSWAPALAPVQLILGVAGDWSRNRFGPGSPTAFTGRLTATLTLRWGGSGGTYAAPRAAQLELPLLDPAFTTVEFPGLAPRARVQESFEAFSR